MSDPKAIDTGDWLGIIGLIGAGVGSVMALFRNSSKKITDRLDAVEGTVYGAPGEAGHDTQLAVLKNTQENTCAQLTEIKVSVHATNAKLDRVLTAIQNK